MNMPFYFHDQWRLEGIAEAGNEEDKIPNKECITLYCNLVKVHS